MLASVCDHTTLSDLLLTYVCLVTVIYQTTQTQSALWIKLSRDVLRGRDHVLLLLEEPGVAFALRCDVRREDHLQRLLGLHQPLGRICGVLHQTKLSTLESKH